MKPVSFAYHRPDSLEDALQQLARRGDTAKLIAGGQSLAPMMNMRVASPSDLIDLNDLSELAYIRDVGDMLEVGAMTRHYQLEESSLVKDRCPLLAQAARTIGHYAIRQRGTLGGSLAHADPVAQLVLIAITLDAWVDIVSHRGRRTLPASAFFLSAMTTALEPDEMIKAVRFAKSAAHEGASFMLFNRRRGDFAIVAVAATVALDEGQVARLRLGVAGVGPVPVAYEALMRRFCGHVPDAAWVARAARAVRDEVAPEDDVRIPAVYRKELTEILAARALDGALQRSGK